MEILTHITTTITFTLFFALFLLSSCFWGRLINKVVGLSKDCSYGDPLVFVAFLALLTVITRYVAIFTLNLKVFFLCVFFGGILGFIVELARRLKNNRKLILQKDIQLFSHKILLVPICLCFVLTLIFSFHGLSSGLEPYLSKNMDYYIWILAADYWKGQIDPIRYSLDNLDNFLLYIDAFGSDIFLGYFTASGFKTTFMGSLGFLVAVYTTLGSLIFLLVSRIFKLHYVLSFLISLLFVFSNFIIYLGFMGFFPHLIGLICYLSFVYILLVIKESDPKKYWMQLLFPICLMYTSYQAAFLLFILIMFCSICLDYYVNNGKAAINVQDIKSLLVKKELLPFFGAIIIPIILLPPMLVTFIKRTLYSLTQVEGYGLNLIDPILFLGIPVDNISLEVADSDTSILSYVFLVLVLVGIFYVYNRYLSTKEKTEAQTIQQKSIKTLFILYLLSIVVYLLFFLLSGNVYKVWKFAAYTLVPLGFFPIALFFTTMQNVFGLKQRLFLLIAIFLAILIVTPKVLAEIRMYHYAKSQFIYLRSPLPLYDKIASYKFLNDTKTKIVFDFNYFIANHLAAIAAEDWTSKIYFIKYSYFLPSNFDFSSFMDEDTVFITNLKYDGLYSGRIYNDKYLSDIFIYDYNYIVENGIIVYYNVNYYTGYIMNKDVRLRVLVPKKFENSDFLLKVTVEEKGLKLPDCSEVFAYIHPEGTEEPPIYSMDLHNFIFPVSAQDVHDNMLNINIHFPLFIPAPRELMHSDPNLCYFRFETVELLPN
ncbi:MAG: hypothetical protein LBE38_02070 [Deltaproteobacteria bacterium]|jgi:hypothetical protein|nr:hypothetical protein [Deltaproteobacteria bacterium]